MNADAFRQLYAYHFAENHKIWNACVGALSPALFTQTVGYSRGSVRDHVLHLMQVEDLWFSALGGVAPAALPPVGADRIHMRAQWDVVEQRMQTYLATLQDSMLFSTPITEPAEDTPLIVWQVLLHVVNHGTDHRAQLLRMLNDFGVTTEAQDYIFYVYDHP